MAVKIKIHNQMDLSCDLCGTRSVKSLIHRLELSGSNMTSVISLCDICVCDLKDAVQDY